MSECYNVIGDIGNEDDPRAVNILESDGSWDIAAPKIPSNKVKQPLEIRKVNIGTTKDHKFIIILGIIGMRQPWRRSLTCCMKSRIYF